MNHSSDQESFRVKELPIMDITQLLESRGYKQEEIQELLKKDVLFVSQEAKRPIETEYEILPPDNVTLKKILSQSLGLKTDVVLDKNREQRYIELLSAEVYVGIILLFAAQTWDLTKGIIANWLYDGFVNFKRDGKRLNARVEIQLVDKKRGITKHIEYSGPADQVGEVIREFDIE